MTRKTPYERKPPIEERLVYTIAEAGRLLDLSERSAYAAAKRGEIPTIKLGGRSVVPKVALEEMLAAAKPASAA